MNQSRRNFTKEFKEAAIRRLELGASVADAERSAIETALRASAGNRTHAAKALGISRRTLHNKLNEYGIS